MAVESAATAAGTAHLPAHKLQAVLAGTAAADTGMADMELVGAAAAKTAFGHVAAPGTVAPDTAAGNIALAAQELMVVRSLAEYSGEDIVAFAGEVPRFPSAKSGLTKLRQA